jgi:hypothetical protein
MVCRLPSPARTQIIQLRSNSHDYAQTMWQRTLLDRCMRRIGIRQLPTGGHVPAALARQSSARESGIVMLGPWSAGLIDATAAGAGYASLPWSLSAAEVVSFAAQVTADDLVAIVRQLFALGKAWVLDGYSRAPAVMIGLTALFLVPPLALAGVMFSGRAGRLVASPPFGHIMTEPREAWIEVGGPDGEVCPLHHDLIQIGRQQDNDICLDEETVHRYHALIERTAESGYAITDVSGPTGNGVRVNGHRVSYASLADGDLVELGAARLRFATASNQQE